MSVKVKLIYIGIYQQKTGRKEETLNVEKNMDSANAAITEYLKDTYGIVPPFNLLVNGMHVIGAIKRGIVLKDADEIKLVPFLSGG